MNEQFQPDTPGREDNTPSGSEPRLTPLFEEATSAKPLGDPAAVPKQIGRFRIEEELGRGGMGVVFRGRDADLNRSLAVKVLLPEHHGNAGLHQRFLEEAQIMGQLQHPGVAPIHEIGKLPDGRPFFSMKQIKGRTLAELLNQGKRKKEKGKSEEAKGQEVEDESSVSAIPGRSLGEQFSEAVFRFLFRKPSTPRTGVPRPEPGNEGLATIHEPRTTIHEELPRLLSIFAQVCQTLAYAHARGIIHRDLKPGNIMVGAFGEVQVMDWGLAKVLGAASLRPAADPKTQKTSTIFTARTGQPPEAETAVGTVLGTPAYMAPEQARGETEQLDERCDVFGLGAILCEILTGQPPFPGNTHIESHRKAMKGNLQEALILLDHCGADAELVQLAKHCLEPEKEKRPRHAGEVAEAVANYQTAVQERLQRAEIERAAAQVKASEERKRRRISLALAGLAVAFVLTASGAGVWYYHEQAVQAAAEAERKTAQARQAAEEAARQQQLEQQIAAALEEADSLHQGLHQQLSAPLSTAKLLSDMEQWQTLVDRSGAAVQRAAALANSSKGSLPAALAARLAAVQKQAEADQKDLEWAKALDEVRLKVATLEAGEWDRFLAAKEYPPQFQKMGFNVDREETAVLAIRIKATPLRFVLVAALDHWIARSPQDSALLPRLAALARQADPDAWRDQVREAKAWTDLPALKALASQAKLQEQSPHVLYLLASKLEKAGGRADAAELLRRALVHHLRDFWLHFWLGVLTPDLTEKVGCYQTALAVRPESSVVHNDLGVILFNNKDLERAIPHFQTAIRFDQNYFLPHYNLGIALGDKKDLDGAIACYRQAIKINPRHALSHYNLGNALLHKDDLDGAVGCYEKAIQLEPDDARFHNHLGIVLLDKKDLEGSVAAHQKAIALKPDYAHAHGALGVTRLAQGNFAEAHAATLEALKLLGPGQPLRTPLEKQLQQCEQLLALDRKLPAVLKGEVQPRSAAELAALAEFCLKYKKQHTAAVQFYREAFAADPKLAAKYRYHAACAAALAAGQGNDADKLDDPEKTKLRQQALAWLKTELAALTKLQANPQAAALVQKRFLHWQKDADLAGVRDEQELARLPQAERKEWQSLWAEVGKIIEQKKK